MLDKEYVERIGPNVALLIIDMINDFEFEHGEDLFSFALPAAKQINLLKEKASQLQIPVIYVNDNYGKWQSDFRHLIDHCLQRNRFSRTITKILQPNSNDYFILKPKYSGFYCTPLEILLEKLKVNTLIITGVAGNMCVQFTASDAYMRDYSIYVPFDCTASITAEENETAIQYMDSVLKAKTDGVDTLDLDTIISQASHQFHKNIQK
ncbi:cysteine hydrolase family protein [Bacillus alkalicellulosilyticus]|uniref:cysteine hydrolase family protein n=1 Tax=Alkalihalobacterium alkalicellulosilyticum TaxID=1912214 RepID=UPI0009977254|nr:isochorismatase family cysteine hydrolase [Bacillus alkalicellulosilyticus]